MLRLILIVVLALFVIVGGLAVALFHFYGWKGLLIFPFILVAVAWLAKVVIGKVFKRLALGLFGMKSGALKGATLNVHSVRSISKPPDRPHELENANEIEDRDEDDDDDAEDDTEDEDEEEAEDAEPEEPELKDYVEIDVTITPSARAGDSVWEPTELILTSEKVKSLMDLQEKEVGRTHSVEVWNGTGFGPDDPGKYPGEQRLKMILAVKPGVTEAWMHYYNEPIGQLKLPLRTIDV